MSNRADFDLEDEETGEVLEVYFSGSSIRTTNLTSKARERMPGLRSYYLSDGSTLTPDGSEYFRKVQGWKRLKKVVRY